jgi:hypothetical protein
LEKSDKFSKIPSSHDLCQNEFSWVHLYVRFRVTKQVPNGLVRIKETSLNLKFNPYNIQYTNQTYKDFTQASEIHSELLFKQCSLCCGGTVEHCSSYCDMRGVTALPLTEISSRDLEGATALTGTTNNRPFPHYGKTKSGWREWRKSSLSQVASSSEWLLHCTLKNLIVLRLVTRSF